ncbi:hypothetical protein [Mesorhizobium sp. M1027]|uniref:hypothetical protein n=1 Tax=Mesorhizobium sp. M1027 TaxID=2957050 RepID=UPI00333AA4C8
MRVFQRILPLAVFALQLFAVQSFAQTEEQDLPGQGASSTTEDAQDVGVDVSLGRHEVKQQIARELESPRWKCLWQFMCLSSSLSGSARKRYSTHAPM